MIRAAIVLAALSASTASAQYAVRYEFDIRVTSNTVTPGSGNTLEPLAVGTVGTYTIDVLNDIDVFPTDDPGFIQIYPVLDFELNIAGVVSGPRPGIYPGAFIHGVFIENDTDTNSFTQVKDNFFVNPIFDDTDFGFSVLYLAEILPFGSTPTLLSGVELPLSMDVTQANYTPAFGIPASSGGRVEFAFDGVTITPIPAPASSILLPFACLAAARRRR